MQSSAGPGGTRKSRPAMNGGPTCLRTLALASVSGAPISPSNKRSIGSPMKSARDHTCRVQQVRLAGGIFARPPDRLSWCGLRDAQPAQPSRRTELQQARLPLGSLRRALRRADRGRAIARPYHEGCGSAGGAWICVLNMDACSRTGRRTARRRTATSRRARPRWRHSLRVGVGSSSKIRKSAFGQTGKHLQPRRQERQRPRRMKSRISRPSCSSAVFKANTSET
jgi:hypothetical protein